MIKLPFEHWISMLGPYPAGSLPKAGLQDTTRLSLELLDYHWNYWRVRYVLAQLTEENEALKQELESVRNQVVLPESLPERSDSGE